MCLCLRERETKMGERIAEWFDLAVEVTVNTVSEDDCADDDLDEVNGEMAGANNLDARLHARSNTLS